ncbi:hypothetical protein niasHT_025868 [Heterodera trifolii]|uniref:Glutamate--cysteine ligase n=1 Tax=Heterodera trifolii TaxID=157864 RepID=A0ABD2KJ60_9BILA
MRENFAHCPQASDSPRFSAKTRVLTPSQRCEKMCFHTATPIFRSYLSDVDSRWPIISASVDDRTPFERGLVSSASDGYSKFNAIPKSRYDSTDCYIYPCSAQYNDIQLQYDEQLYQRLIAGSVDEHLARHIAHMFIRDPLQVFEERIVQDDQKSTEHFETIQSSNWMNMRFKPPPPDDPNIGWRVEFRPTEVQLTHFENAAYCCFLVLLTRVIVSYRLTFLIPISLVTENMQRAVRRDAISTQKLHFRKTLAHCWHTPEGKPCPEGRPPAEPEPEPYGNNVAEMSIDEIVNGNTDFPGLVPLMLQFLNSADVDVDTRCTVNQYLSFIQKRARGEIWTTAKWMREFVHQHQTYEKDSHVPDECIYDMMKKMDSISRGEHCEKLLGCFKTKTEQRIPSAVKRAEEEMTMLIARRKAAEAAAASAAAVKNNNDSGGDAGAAAGSAGASGGGGERDSNASVADGQLPQGAATSGGGGERDSNASVADGQLPQQSPPAPTTGQ